MKGIPRWNIIDPLILVARQDEGRSDRRRHDRIGSLDGLPDDLVEEQIVGAVLDLQVEAHRDFGHGSPSRVPGVQVDTRRAMDVGTEVGLGR